MARKVQRMISELLCQHLLFLLMLLKHMHFTEENAIGTKLQNTPKLIVGHASRCFISVVNVILSSLKHCNQLLHFSSPIISVTKSMVAFFISLFLQDSPHQLFFKCVIFNKAYCVLFG